MQAFLCYDYYVMFDDPQMIRPHRLFRQLFNYIKIKALRGSLLDIMNNAWCKLFLLNLVMMTYEDSQS